MVEFYEYQDKIRNGKYDNVYNAFNRYHRMPCLYSFIAGGLIPMFLSLQTNPEGMWYLVIGCTARGFFARFR